MKEETNALDFSCSNPQCKLEGHYFFLTPRQPYWISSDVISLHLHACLISAMPMSGFEITSFFVRVHGACIWMVECCRESSGGRSNRETS